MKNLSLHISNLLLVLIAIKFTYSEAGKIQNLSLNVSQNVNFDEKNLAESSVVVEKVEKVSSSETQVVASQQGARDTKYSYFYIGRWTWHIPLWFTLWFSFYVFFNVIRSIYGHTVS
jgi:hypothetical protein